MFNVYIQPFETSQKVIPFPQSLRPESDLHRSAVPSPIKLQRRHFRRLGIFRHVADDVEYILKKNKK